MSNTITFTILAVILVLFYALYNILTFYDFQLSYLGSYIAFYIFMLISSLVLPARDFMEGSIEPNDVSPAFVHDSETKLSKGTADAFNSSKKVTFVL